MCISNVHLALTYHMALLSLWINACHSESIIRAEKKALNSNLPFKLAAHQFYLPWASPSLPFITQLADDLLGPLCTGYVRMKSDSLGRKITLSWTTGRHSFQALIISCRISTYMYCVLLRWPVTANDILRVFMIKFYMYVILLSSHRF